MRFTCAVFLITILLFSCSPKIAPPPPQEPAPVTTTTPVAQPDPLPLTPHRLDSVFLRTEERFKDHTGFVLYDPEKQQTLYSFNADRYFTPGSNTKILTFFTALKILGDSVPALRYIDTRDSLIFWGTGDPSFLYKYVFTDDKAFSFLKNSRRPLYFSNSNFATSHFGAGWAWDDYSDYYSTERSPLPIYGNIFWAEITRSGVTVKPDYFRKHMRTGEKESRPKIERDLFTNDFVYHPPVTRRVDTLDIPFRIDAQFIATLLSDTLNRPVNTIERRLPADAKTIFSVPADSLYKVMMQESDNMIAEQLLLMCAGILSDTLQPEIAIDYVLKNYLGDLSDEPEWVDGSGLSRYNLFTPRSIVQVWERIYHLVPRERLLPLLATGGVNGTLKRYFKSGTPYIFGKTGSLSNNHCLSGYIITRRGKLLIFSFMNSNFTAKMSDVRKNMEDILNGIYEQY
ncbi:MAG TPA: D-alanyl-D-alanine carboxypeptidase [Ohtaekwangia sp.]|nr:D-alanyl-D-alanine carboxypeptidase [Ohtaekwangia sp.]